MLAVSAAAGEPSPGLTGQSPAEGNPLRALAEDLGLSLFTGPLTRTLRVPLTPRETAPVGTVQPYAAVTPRGLGTGTDEGASPTGSQAPEVPDPAVDMGAGLRWQFSERVELFGEYRLLQLKPGPSGGGTGPRPGLEEPEIKGGFSVRF